MTDKQDKVIAEKLALLRLDRINVLEAQLLETQQALSELTEINEMGIADYKNLRRELVAVNKRKETLRKETLQAAAEATCAYCRGVSKKHIQEANREHGLWWHHPKSESNVDTVLCGADGILNLELEAEERDIDGDDEHYRRWLEELEYQEADE